MADGRPSRFRAHTRVVHETLDDEVIVIQIESGLYYSLTGSGAEIWALVHRGHTVDEAVGALERRFDADPETIRGAVVDLVARLHDESLLEAVDGDLPLAPDQAANGVPRRPFAPPLLERFDDMQDFLLVDPVHEVDDTGWPHVKT